MWRYFIELLQGRCAGDYIQGPNTPDGMPVCNDLNYAMDFESPEALQKWVVENTELSCKAEEYMMIKGVYFPYYSKTGCW